MSCNCDELKAAQVVNNQKLDDLLARLSDINTRLTALENANYRIDVTDAVRAAIAPLLTAIQQQ